MVNLPQALWFLDELSVRSLVKRMAVLDEIVSGWMTNAPFSYARFLWASVDAVNTRFWAGAELCPHRFSMSSLANQGNSGRLVGSKHRDYFGLFASSDHGVEVFARNAHSRIVTEFELKPLRQGGLDPLGGNFASDGLHCREPIR